MTVSTIYGPITQANLSGRDTVLSMRQVCVIAGDSQGAISIRFQAPSLESGFTMSVKGAAFGLRVGGNDGNGTDTEDTPIQLTFNGNPDFHYRTGEVWSDFVEHPGMSITAGTILVVIFDVYSPDGDADNRRFHYGDTSANTAWVYEGVETRTSATPGVATEETTGRYGVGFIKSDVLPRITQRFVSSADNSVIGHKDLKNGTDTVVSDEYAMGEEQPNRIAFAFFIVDSGTAVDAYNPVFRIDGGADVPAQMVGSQANGGNYIAWVEAPTGDLIEFQCNIETDISVYFEYIFFGYGMSSTQFDVAGEDAAGTSFTIDRAEMGTTIGWTIATSETGWGGTSPTLVQQAERIIFGTNRQIEIGLTMEDIASVGDTISYSTAFRIIALTLGEGDVEPPEDVLNGTGLSRIEFGSPGGVRTNGMLHPIDSGV